MKTLYDDARIDAVKDRFAKGDLNRRDFLTHMVAAGVSVPAAQAMLKDLDPSREAGLGKLETKTFRVTGYTIHLGDKLLITVGGRAIAPRAMIECKGDNQEQLTLHFLGSDRAGDESNSERNPNTTSFTSNRVLGNMFLPVQQYPWYVDLLRNEDPVYATLDNALPLNNRVWCGEFVGDGENLVG
jgi:hypothetical protein